MLTLTVAGRFLSPQPKRDKFAGLSRKQKRRKLALEEEEAERTAGVGAAIREAKKAQRPAKLGEPERRPAKGKAKDKKRDAKRKEELEPTPAEGC